MLGSQTPRETFTGVFGRSVAWRARRWHSLYRSALDRGFQKRSPGPPSPPMGSSTSFRRACSVSSTRSRERNPITDAQDIRTVGRSSLFWRDSIRSPDRLKHNGDFLARAGLGLMLFNTWTYRPPPSAKSLSPTSKCQNRTPGISPRLAMAECPAIRDSERMESIRE